ncbi:hypothetical protein [Streptomyces sp. NBC_01233]|uniref:hypothetical protein n=1 Tax=Streptomyces sp. NBC_01233 TaxID=2903787 RepID=UPI002E15F21B|nr:hypothetical protein OG332_24225 [Streptomyces sp. NBC_01233]
MRPDEIVHGDPAYLVCQAVRVTPYAEGNFPDHDRAHTFRFEDPVTLIHVQRAELQDITQETRYRRQPPDVLAFFAADDNPQPWDLAALTHLTRWNSPGYVAVEVWMEHPGGWAYALFPHWREGDVEDWPSNPAPGVPVVALGRAERAASPWVWPTPDGPGYGVHAGTTAVLVDSVAPPPPAGPATLSPTRVRASGGVLRTPVLVGEDIDCGPLPTRADSVRTGRVLTGPDTARPPVYADTEDTRRTPPDTDTGQGVRVEYRARVPRRLLGAAVVEAFAHIARETRADTGRTPPADTPPPTLTPGARREEAAAAIADAFDVPQHLVRKDPQS